MYFCDRVLMQDSVVAYNKATNRGSVFNVESAQLISFENVTFEHNSGAIQNCDLLLSRIFAISTVVHCSNSRLLFLCQAHV